MSNENFIPYMGGKFQIGQWIVSHFPKHTCFVLPMGGSASTLYAKPRSKVEVYNDKWDGIVTLFQVVREQSEALQEYLLLVPYSRTLHKKWSKRIKVNEFESDLEKAACVYYLLSCSFDGEIGAGFKTSVTNPQAQIYAKRIKNITSFVDRLRGVLIECLDFREVIPKYDSEETLFYIDPPYLDKPRDYYLEDFTYRDHWDLAKLLLTIKGKTLVSYYPTENVKELYPEDSWFYILKEVPKHSQKAKGEEKERATEALICNFDPEARVIGKQQILSEVWA